MVAEVAVDVGQGQAGVAGEVAITGLVQRGERSGECRRCVADAAYVAVSDAECGGGPGLGGEGGLAPVDGRGPRVVFGSQLKPAKAPVDQSEGVQRPRLAGGRAQPLVYNQRTDKVVCGCLKLAQHLVFTTDRTQCAGFTFWPPGSSGMIGRPGAQVDCGLIVTARGAQQ